LQLLQQLFGGCPGGIEYGRRNMNVLAFTGSRLL
jgi:hypothetical protein